MYPCELITSELSLGEVLASSRESPCLILKHSTRCPISTNGLNAFKDFLSKDSSVAAYIILVVENRSVSLLLADKIDVQHQSPQAILISNEQSLWDASHSGITADSLSSAVSSLVK